MINLLMLHNALFSKLIERRVACSEVFGHNINLNRLEAN